MKPIELSVYTDGGSRGNPGPSAIGIVVEESGEIIFEHSQYIGTTTNNVAEYTALYNAFQKILQKFGNKTCEINIKFFLDSELVVKQITGKYKIRDSKLLEYYLKIKNDEKNFCKITYTHVKRELNKKADILVNRALDIQSF